MARLARITVPGYPHHVMQRGYNEQTVFETEADYRRYLDWLREYTARFSVDIWAYCLMPNHVHVICVPRAPDSLARAFNSLHMRYAQYFNAKRGMRGPVWRPRFMSCVLDDPSVREELRFVESNPVRARLVQHAEDYLWSSALAHVSGDTAPDLENSRFSDGNIGSWCEYLKGRREEVLIGRTRARLKTGRPSGNSEFVAMLEKIVGRRLEALPMGRPRKYREI